MQNEGSFWNLAGLTDGALLGGLSRLVGSGRQLLGEVIAHLAEVEERRLHLDAGFGSMFAYCVSRLGLSEDEAYRRIKVARLARRHSGIFPRLASGQLSLSVVALLEPHLSSSNSEELLELVSGQSVTRAREALAGRFPRADVPSSIRKLPGPQLATSVVDDSEAALPLLSSDTCRARSASTLIRGAPLEPDAPTGGPPNKASNRTTTPATPSPPPKVHGRVVPPVRQVQAARTIEPLSAARYKIQLTADTALKEKLELARDLMRHTQPDGDFAPILSRALDLLIEELMKRRFGARSKRTVAPPIDRHGAGNSVKRNGAANPNGASKPVNGNGAANPVNRHGATDIIKPEAAAKSIDLNSLANPNQPEPLAVAHVCEPTRTISRSTRRIVCERDGLRCTWRGADGVRCESRAWLENDHADPRGRGGSSEPENVRLLCRAHNQRAAELHYGRRHMADAITRARKGRSMTRTSGNLQTASPACAPREPTDQKAIGEQDSCGGALGNER